MNVLIVTACPGGMVTSILSARLLDAAARRLGWSTQVEVQGRPVEGSTLNAIDIAAADLVLVVKTGSLALERFIGKRVVQATPVEALLDPQRFLREAAEHAEVLTGDVVVPVAEPSSVVPRLVAVTACPTGVAHTFMAAEALQQAATRLGYDLRVETRGSVGARNLLDAESIARADAVILAADIDVDLTRFAGKRIYPCSTGRALKQPQETLERALREATVLDGAAAASPEPVRKGERHSHVYKHLLTGVSYMLPMVVAGGLLIALSFVLGIEAHLQSGTLAAALWTIGDQTAFLLMVPLLAGYIAYSIADRPGLAPGMIGGLLATTLEAGFLGGIAAGFTAGYSALAISQWLRLPVSVESLKPVLIIPLLVSLVTGLTMIYVIGEPVAQLLVTLTRFLDTMGTSNAVLLGLLLGAMMCVDLGGPLNKASYAFSVGLLASQSYAPMAATMAAGMVPPLGMAVACFLARHKFAETERNAGKASFVLGLCFISEGAIPFAAKDPLRVIPACVAGGALAGALSMLFNCKLLAPHGGLFVLLIPNTIAPVLGYLVAIAAGSLLTGGLYALLKRGRSPELEKLAGKV